MCLFSINCQHQDDTASKKGPRLSNVVKTMAAAADLRRKESGHQQPWY